MSSFCKCKSYSHFFGKNISIYAIFNDQSFNDTLTNDMVSFEQMGPGLKVNAIKSRTMFLFCKNALVCFILNLIKFHI